MWETQEYRLRYSQKREKTFKKYFDLLYKINPLLGKLRSYNYQELEEFVKNNPDKYLCETMQVVLEQNGQKPSFGGIHKTLKTLNTYIQKIYKKYHFYSILSRKVVVLT